MFSRLEITNDSDHLISTSYSKVREVQPDMLHICASVHQTFGKGAHIPLDVDAIAHINMCDGVCSLFATPLLHLLSSITIRPVGLESDAPWVESRLMTDIDSNPQTLIV